MRKKQPRISQKLIQLFLLLLLPQMILGTLIFWYNAREMEHNIADMTEKSVLSLRDELEQAVLDISDDLYMLVSQSYEKDVRGFLIYQDSFSTSEYYITIRNISTILREIRARHDLVDDIQVVYPSLAQSISVDIGLQTCAEDLSTYLDAAAASPSGRLTELNGRLCVMHAIPSPFRSDNAQILVIAYLSSENLTKALSVPPYPDQPTALIHMDSALTIANQAYAIFSKFSTDEYQVFEAKSDILHGRIEKQLRTDDVFAVSKRLSQLLFIFLIVSCLLFIFYSFFVQRLVSYPVARLTEGMSRMRRGDLTSHIHPAPQTEEFARLTDGLNQTMDQLNGLIETNYQQEINNRIFELKHLQAQINPHFLYNSLYTLRHMIQCEDNESAEIMVQHLGDYFRYTASTDKMETSLSEEYEHGRNYLDIQCIRFKDWLKAEYQKIPSGWQTIQVPKLIIQPLYENAVSYAVRKEGSELLIRTSFSIKDGCGVICVEDSGTDLDDDKLLALQRHLFERGKEDKVTALYNIYRRLQLRYGDDGKMHLSKSELGGLCVELYFPLQ